MASARRLTLNERIYTIKAYYQTNSYKHIYEDWENNFATDSPSKRTIQTLVSKFETTGCATDAPRSGPPKVVCSGDNKDLVAATFVNSPKKSQRRASLELGISRRSLSRMMTEIGLKPYRPRALQALNEDDPDRRLEFCENFVAFHNVDPSILDKIIWTDEAIFKLNGRVNRHNCVYWADRNPHEILEREMNLPGVLVWGGLSSSGLIGPFFFEGTVNATSYEALLETKVWPVLSRRPDVNELMFHQDGAPAHYSLKARKWLDDHFPKRWIGRRGTIEWPARSPDLTPLDFFLWGVLKDKVFSRKPRTIASLKDIIIDEWQQITPDMCLKVAHSVVRRYEDCIKVGGHQFEHLD